MLRNLDQRDLQPEILDQPNLDSYRHNAALIGLARVNNLSRVAKTIWQPIGELAVRYGVRELTICDVACGGGDVGLALIRIGQQNGVRIKLTGYDVNPMTIERARRQAESTILGAEFEVCDVLSDAFNECFDVIICSLFLHHLEEAQVVRLLEKTRVAARRLIVISDLKRNRVGYLAAQVVGRILTRSEIVHADGPQSVAAAFRLDEIRRLADEAGLRGAMLRNSWPFRFLMTWESLPNSIFAQSFDKEPGSAVLPSVK